MLEELAKPITAVSADELRDHTELLMELFLVASLATAAITLAFFVQALVAT